MCIRRGRAFPPIAGYEEPVLRLILEVAPKVDERGAHNIATLIEKAIPRLAFSSPGFARDLIGQFTGEQRKRIVEAFVSQARHLGSGVFTGDPDDYMAQRKYNLQIRWLLFRTNLVLRGSRDERLPDF